MERAIFALPVSERDLELIVEAVGSVDLEHGLSEAGRALLERARELRGAIRERERW